MENELWRTRREKTIAVVLARGGSVLDKNIRKKGGKNCLD